MRCGRGVMSRKELAWTNNLIIGQKIVQFFNELGRKGLVETDVVHSFHDFWFLIVLSVCCSEKSPINCRRMSLIVDVEEWIVIDRTKTNSSSIGPLLPRARAILQKYGNCPVNGSKGILLPILLNQKMSVCLKELANICEINKNISMHVARHTFATSITLPNGVPIETVSKMLGHNSLKTMQIYARVVDRKISDDMKRLRGIL